MISVKAYLVCISAGIFAGWLLHDLWQSPHHGLDVTIGGAIAAAISFAYLLWRRRTAKT